MSVDVANESGVEVDEARLVALARHILDRLQVHPLAELSVLVVDEEAMGKLHAKWMDESGPTDVLAFPMDELRPGRDDDAPPEPGLLGDVVLCPQVAAVQARSAGHGSDDELDVLCTHGILHLLGYDHAEPEAEREMFRLQADLLASWQDRGGRVGGDGAP
ncbi:MAG: rRNA maturation RNase YbeY [Streptosporangiales bacterium]|nr:rRNA maturation RNase YbeY [Streptosporangiales bacterium]